MVAQLGLMLEKFLLPTNTQNFMLSVCHIITETVVVNHQYANQHSCCDLLTTYFCQSFP